MIILITAIDFLNNEVGMVATGQCGLVPKILVWSPVDTEVVYARFEQPRESKEVIIEEKIYNFEYPKDISNSLLIENSIMSIIRNGGPKNFEQLYRNLLYSYKIDISEIKLKDLLWKMTLEQKICKDSENYKLIVVN